MKSSTKTLLIDVAITQNVKGGRLEYYSECINIEVGDQSLNTMKSMAFSNQLDAKNTDLANYLDGLIHAGLGTACDPDRKRDLPQIQISVSEYDICENGSETYCLISDVIASSCLEIIGVADALNLEDATVTSETDTVGLFERFETTIRALLSDFGITPISAVAKQSNDTEGQMKAA